MQILKGGTLLYDWNFQNRNLLSWRKILNKLFMDCMIKKSNAYLLAELSPEPKQVQILNLELLQISKI